MMADDDWGDDPGKTENRSWPGAAKSGRFPFEESERREEIERREHREPPPERPPDRDED